MNHERIPVLEQKRLAEPGPLPSLIDDLRENSILVLPVESEVTEGKPIGVVYMKTHAFTAVEHQGLFAPDKNDKTSIADITEAPAPLLQATFTAASDVTNHFLSNSSIERVQVGYHFSGQEKKKGVASQPHFHMHVVGFTRDELNTSTVSYQEARQDHVLKIQMAEPMHVVIHDIITHQVLPVLAEDENFSAVLEPHIAASGKVIYTFKDSSEGITDPRLPAALQQMHLVAQQAYNNLADCFFQKNDTMFALGGEERYIPLPADEIINRLQDYFTQFGDSLSLRTKRHLQLLAVRGKTMETIYAEMAKRRDDAIYEIAHQGVDTSSSQQEGEELTLYSNRHDIYLPPEVEKYLTFFEKDREGMLANLLETRGQNIGGPLTLAEMKKLFERFGLINNLAYAVNFTAEKTSSGTQWTMAFEPMAFTKRGFPQAPPKEDQMVLISQLGNTHTDEIKTATREKEAKLKVSLLALPNRNYQNPKALFSS